MPTANRSHPLKISVILPVYNGAAFLQESVNSLLEQSESDFELIIIDDCSTDGTPQLLEAITDPRVRLARTEQNSGPGKARNLGFDMAEGRYIALNDSDDISRKDRLKIQFDFMERNPEISVCGGVMEKFGAGQGLLVYPESNEAIRARVLLGGIIPNPTVMFRGSFVRENAVRYEADFIEDYEMWLRLVHRYKNCKFINLPEILVSYRVHAGNTTQMHSEKWRKAVSDIRLPYLENLCGELTQDDRDILDDIYLKRKAESKEEVVLVKEWLLKLRSANREKEIYDKNYFELFLMQHFLTICTSCLWLGPWVVRQLIQYPEFTSSGIEARQVKALMEAAAQAYTAAQQNAAREAL